MELIKISDLNVQFDDSRLSEDAVCGLSFTVAAGECVGIVGESGSGKSTAMKALMGLLPAKARISCQEFLVNGKTIIFPGCSNNSSAAVRRYEEQMQQIRGKEIAMIFQDPAACLNPAIKVGKQISEAVLQHRGCSTSEAREEALALLHQVGIRNPRQRYLQYPFELSGGMRQRVVIAIALACEPRLLIADEPTASLDATVRKQILGLLGRIAEEMNTAIIMVTHDLGAAAAVCERILVMKNGRIVEAGGIHEIFHTPVHAYTQELVRCFGPLGKNRDKADSESKLLEIRQLTKLFPNQHSWFDHKSDHAVRDVTIDICEGEVFGIVGESGSGKSTLARILAGIMKPTSGEVFYRGKPLQTMEKRQKAEIQMIFQHSLSSFNPHFRIRQVLEEALLYQTDFNAEERTQQILSMLSLVGLEQIDQNRYPAQFSGGEQQRIGIARALLPGPKLVICDEPVSALDAAVQRQILSLLKSVQKQRGLAYLFISHDLNVIRYMSRRVGVMYFGNLVEMGITEDVYQEPWHPYTQELLNAVRLPRHGASKRKQRIISRAEADSAGSGCSYYMRCGYKLECCKSKRPPSYQFGDREVACFLYSEEHSGRRGSGYPMISQI